MVVSIVKGKFRMQSALKFSKTCFSAEPRKTKFVDEEYVHFNSFDLNPPTIGGLIQSDLHTRANRVPVREDFVEWSRTKNVPQRGLSEEPGAVMGILYIRY